MTTRPTKQEYKDANVIPNKKQRRELIKEIAKSLGESGEIRHTMVGRKKSHTRRDKEQSNIVQCILDSNAPPKVKSIMIRDFYRFAGNIKVHALDWSNPFTNKHQRWIEKYDIRVSAGMQNENDHMCPN